MFYSWGKVCLLYFMGVNSPHTLLFSCCSELISFIWLILKLHFFTKNCAAGNIWSNWWNLKLLLSALNCPHLNRFAFLFPIFLTAADLEDLERSPACRLNTAQGNKVDSRSSGRGTWAVRIITRVLNRTFFAKWPSLTWWDGSCGVRTNISCRTSEIDAGSIVFAQHQINIVSIPACGRAEMCCVSGTESDWGHSREPVSPSFLSDAAPNPSSSLKTVTARICRDVSAKLIHTEKNEQLFFFPRMSSRCVNNQSHPKQTA